MKLVLIPGLDGTGDLFAPFVEALGSIDCQVISYPPDREMNYAAHEAHVRERLPVSEAFVLLAESFSGPVGISISASPPPNLKGLILCCSFASNPLPVFGPLSQFVAMFPAMRIPPALFAPFLYSGYSTPELRGAHADAMAKVKASTLRARVAAILAVDHSEQLPGIQVPLHYLLARGDRLVPRAAFEKIHRLCPAIGLDEFDGPHFLLQTKARECAVPVARLMNIWGSH